MAKNYYPARFYAGYDRAAPQPTPVTGWYDMTAYSSLEGLPPASELLPLTPEQWDARLPCGQGVLDGKIVPYTPPPPPPPPLKTQAETALQNARADIYNNYGIIGEPTPDAWVAYLKSLMAIVSGADTTSTTLPTAPSDPTT